MPRLIGAVQAPVQETQAEQITIFNSTGTLTTQPRTTSLTYLVIGGGASGGGHAQYSGGGGGAGGYRTGPTPVSSASPYPVIVGGGGAGTATFDGNNGSSSTLGTPTPITSAGGGAGAYYEMVLLAVQAVVEAVDLLVDTLVVLVILPQ